jgi:hypothetical protein
MPGSREFTRWRASPALRTGSPGRRQSFSLRLGFLARKLASRNERNGVNASNAANHKLESGRQGIPRKKHRQREHPQRTPNQVIGRVLHSHLLTVGVARGCETIRSSDCSSGSSRDPAPLCPERRCGQRNFHKAEQRLFH